MKDFHKGFRTWIGAKPVLGMTLSLILTLTALVQSSRAERGICFPFEGYGATGCCYEDVDCGEGRTCVFNKEGVCISRDGSEPSTIPCNATSECSENELCLPMGECYDGKPCLGTEGLGICIDDGGRTCLTARDCNRGICAPICLLYPPLCIIMNFCEGACFRCATGAPCYIATATFGTELEDKTEVLRSFRDKYLLNNGMGKAFVTAYYKYSPALANCIAERAWLRAVVRVLLLPVIGLASLFV